MCVLKELSAIFVLVSFFMMSFSLSEKSLAVNRDATVINGGNAEKVEVACHKSEGKFICWVYGSEGNELYLLIFNNLRRITILLPDFILRVLTNILNIIAYPYIFLCKIFPLPLKKYLIEVFSKCSYSNRNYIIFDQLNPSYAKYFKKEEIYELLKDSGFKKIDLYHRHGYSWTVICQK